MLKQNHNQSFWLFRMNDHERRVDKNMPTPLRIIAPIMFGFGKSRRFVPDLHIKDGQTLSQYGFDATVLTIPGHSRGSIGILTTGGNLLCGDLLENTDKPALNAIMDDLAAANASVEKLSGFSINTVYPWHGKPFSMGQFLDSRR